MELLLILWHNIDGDFTVGQNVQDAIARFFHRNSNARLKELTCSLRCGVDHCGVCDSKKLVEARC